MDRFPVELKLALFYVLPDIPTLDALLRTCSSFYCAFKDSQSLIVSTVLTNGIHPAVVPDAVALWDATRVEPWSKDAIEAFLKRYRISGPSSAPSPWTFLEASRFSKIDRRVQFFTQDFCSSILSVHPITGEPDPDHEPPSTSELCRIQRILYRFELYCALFRIHKPESKKERFTVEEQQELFFTKFWSWENEQLACIHDYLLRQVTQVVLEYAEHDVAWGHHGFYPTWMDENSLEEGYLSQGLDYLHSLLTAETYYDRSMVLEPHKPSDYCFLTAGLQAQENEDDYGAGQRQLRGEAHDYDIQALSAGDDSGPIEAWCWANGSETLYYEHDQADLREWGYCLWDKSRLEAWGLFRKPWTSQRAYDRRLRVSFDKQRQVERIERSQHEKSRIYQYGGSGWWAEGDESKIIWSHGTPAEQQKRTEVKKRGEGCRLHGPNGYRGRDGDFCPPGCLAREGERRRVGTAKE